MLNSVELLGPAKAGLGSASAPEMKSDDVMLSILAVGICGSDLHIYREGNIGSAVAQYPFIPGHEAVARVDDAANEADRHLAGKRVSIEPTIFCRKCAYCLSGSSNLCLNQSFVSLPPFPGLMREKVAHPAYLIEEVPEILSDAAATLLEPMAVSLNTIDLLKARSGNPLVIIGCGAIGLTCLILSKRAGLSPVLCIEPLAHRREKALELGATMAVAPEEAHTAAEKLTRGLGFPYVIEASGSDDGQTKSAELAAPGAKVSVVGTNMGDHVTFPGHMSRRKGLTFLMVRRSRNTLKRCCAIAEEKTVAAELELLVSHVFQPAEAQRAFDTAAYYRDGAVKVVISFAIADIPHR